MYVLSVVLTIVIYNQLKMTHAGLETTCLTSERTQA